jgi:Na+/melibiose symporter-like transporter
MTGSTEGWAYRGGAAVASVTSFLIVWTTIVRDDGTGMAYFLLIMAAMVGGFSAWFTPAGMARTMLGVAIMQALLGVATATAPITASVPDGPLRALLFNGVFAGLWLVSALLFRVASNKGHEAVAAR